MPSLTLPRHRQPRVLSAWELRHALRGEPCTKAHARLLRRRTRWTSWRVLAGLLIDLISLVALIAFVLIGLPFLFGGTHP